MLRNYKYILAAQEFGAPILRHNVLRTDTTRTLLECLLVCKLPATLENWYQPWLR